MIPAALLSRFYLDDSLRNVDGGFEFKLKNVVAPTTVTALGPVEVDGVPYAADQVTLTASKPKLASQINAKSPFHFPMGKVVTVFIQGAPLPPGEHELAVHALTKEVGAVVIGVHETL